MLNPTKAEKDRERRKRAEKEREKKEKEQEEAKKKKKPETPAEKYGKNLCKYAWRGNVKRCARCIRKGASVEYANPISLSRPLHRACLGGSLETVKYLIEEHKAMLNTCDDEEWSPLHFAASKGFKEICIYLVEKNANIDAKDNAGNTPLHLAAAKGHAETVEALVFYGANVAERNAANKSAGDVASTRRIARAIAGLQRDLEEEAREDIVTGRLRGEGEEKQAAGKPSEDAGEFFDATELYGFEFSSDDEIQT